MKNISPRSNWNLSIRLMCILSAITAVTMTAYANEAVDTNRIGSAAFRQAIAPFSVSPTPDPNYKCVGRSEDTISQFGLTAVPNAERWGFRFVDAGRECDIVPDTDGLGGDSGADGVDAMDFDGDCDLDIVTGWEESGKVFVYLNPLFTQRPVSGPCPERVFTDNTVLRSTSPIAKEWPVLEITRAGIGPNEKPFRGVEDAIFADHDGDGVADYIVISTETAEEVFVSVPTPTIAGGWNWHTFKLPGEGQQYMRAVVKDIDMDGCPDILTGSKGGGARIRWWRCNSRYQPGDALEWDPKRWKAGEGEPIPTESILRSMWGGGGSPNPNTIENTIHWIMEMNVVNIVKGNNPGGTKDYPEILFTDRTKIGYMYVKDAAKITQPDGWKFVRIDNPNADDPFRWYQIGQLIDDDGDRDLSIDDPNDPFEIVVAYNRNAGRGVFGRWYKCVNWHIDTGCPNIDDAWQINEIVVDVPPQPGATPHTQAQPLPWDRDTSKATGVADLDGDGKSEIIGTIRGNHFSGVFSLTPIASTGPPQCRGNSCGDDQEERWTLKRISPFYHRDDPNQIKHDNLALIDVDLDCDIDIFTVDENLGGGPGLGTIWLENPLVQRPGNRNCPNVLPVINVVSEVFLDEASMTTRTVSVTDADDDVALGNLTVDHGTLTPGDPGNWTWSYTAENGPSNVDVTFTATDYRGGSSEKVVNVLVINVPPTLISVSGPGQINEGSTAIINVNATDPYDPIQYSYDCDDNGVYEIGPVFSNQGFCVFNSDGAKRVNVRVADGDGGVDFGFVNVTVLNVPPAITSVVLGPVSGEAVEGNTFQLIAVFTDPGTEIFSCSINYGDGTGTLPVAPGNLGGVWRCIGPPHVYRDSGIYSASVTVGDGTATTQTVSSISVANVAPSVALPTINPSQDVDVNEHVLASVTFSDPAGAADAPFDCTIDLGAGGALVAGVLGETTCSMHAAHSYSQTGTYTVTFAITDKDGGIGTSSGTVNVINLPPVVANPVISIGSVAEGDSFSIESTFTDGGDNGPYSCTVNYGDGTGNRPGTITGPLGRTCMGPLHVYQDNGEYQMLVTVTDQDNISGQNARTVNVSNVAPQVSAAGTTISENGVADVFGTISDPSPLDSFTLLINWADGTTESIFLPAGTTSYCLSHQYLDDDPTNTPADTVNVAVEVTDDDGGVGAAVGLVTINNVHPIGGIDSIRDSFGNLVGSDVSVLLEDLAFTVGASFTDIGTLDTHIASIDWGDGTSWNAPAAGTVTQTHTYANAGDHLITFTVTDDDTGTSTVTRSVRVVSAAGALTNVIEVLQTALVDPNTDPQTQNLIQQALNELAGQAGGTGNNGALSLLESRAWTAMMEKVERAVSHLEQAGLQPLATQLVMAVKSLLVGLVDQCAALARTPREHAAVAQARMWIANGDAATTLAGKLEAYGNVFRVLRPAFPH